MARGTHWLRLASLTVALGLAVSACGGSNIKETSTASGKSCSDFNVAVNPWTGYEADAYVVGTLATEKLGCNVSYQNVKEESAGRACPPAPRTPSSRTGATPT